MTQSKYVSNQALYILQAYNYPAVGMDWKTFDSDPIQANFYQINYGMHTP